MADEAETIELKSAATLEQQAEAEKLGWIPHTRFKGDAANFVDAGEYIEKSKIVLPILRKANDTLRGEVSALHADHAATKAALAKAQKALDEIEERNTVSTQKAVEQARKEVKAQLAAASEAGDHAGVAELTERMVELNAAVDEAPPAKKAEEKPAPYAPPPELVSWQSENTWYGSDKRKTALALGIAQDLRDHGETSVGRAFMDKVTDEMRKELRSAGPGFDKVEADKGGAGHRGNGKKGFDDLPADAKEACQKDTKQFVGTGKKYKTAAEWHSRYAELYFQE